MQVIVLFKWCFECNWTNLKSTTANCIDQLSNNKLIDGILGVALDLA